MKPSYIGVASLLFSVELIPFPNHSCLGAKPQAVH